MTGMPGDEEASAAHIIREKARNMDDWEQALFKRTIGGALFGGQLTRDEVLRAFPAPTPAPEALAA